MARFDCDVLVVGAGPAGSVAAYRLAEAGCRVILIDAGSFPREKACGGGVQQRALSHIPVDARRLFKSSLRKTDFSFALGNRFSKASRLPLVYGVLRTEFDEFLLRAAADMGVEVREETRLTGATLQAGGAFAETTAGDIRARYIVGADGANSVVSRLLNSRDNFFWQVALYCEIPLPRALEGTMSQESMRVDLGTLPAGYAWLFPKGETVNAGVGGPLAMARNLGSYFRAFLRAERLLGNSAAAPRISGHLLPTMTERTMVAATSALLVGDAAGLVEPLTGEGISHACESGELAARAILKHFGKPELAAIYGRIVHDGMGTELHWGRRLLSFTIAFPRLFYRLLHRNDAAWRCFCDVLGGHRDFATLWRVVAGRASLLGGPLDAFLRHMERRRLRSPGGLQLDAMPPG
ncbi:MAG: NAD(P)/FAD-dependent oxidoreductase [Bryobacteraceae bacterium]